MTTPSNALAPGLAFPLGDLTPAKAPPDPQSLSFGTDLVFRGRLVVAQGDYQEVTGLDNLRASIFRRLSTAKGAFKIRPEYGCGVPGYLKKPMTKSVLDALSQDIVSQLNSDPRVAGTSVALTPSTINGVRGLIVAISVKTLGRTMTFQPFTFTEKAA